jgi:uncharacterized protein (TIGR02265 family)
VAGMRSVPESIRPSLSHVVRSVPESIRPSLIHSIEVERYLKACPLDETTQGVFLQYIRDEVVKRMGSAPPKLFEGLPRNRWVPFLKYPLRELMHLVVNAARVLHPKQPLAEGIRRVGWFAYPSFAATMAGRVVLFAFGETVEDVIRSLPKAYSICIPEAEASVKDYDDGHLHVELRNVHCFVDTYHRGVLEGALWYHGFDPSVEVTAGPRLCDANLVANW